MSHSASALSSRYSPSAWQEKSEWVPDDGARDTLVETGSMRELSECASGMTKNIITHECWISGKKIGT